MDMEKSPAFQEFLKLLNENGRAVQGQDLSLMAWYLDGMERQFDAVLQELQSVKAELAQVSERQAPAKFFLSKMVEALETRVERARNRLLTFCDRIVECAQDAVDRFKDAGVSALDSAITAMGVKKGLEHLQEGLQNSLSGIRDAIGKAEDVGHELRSVGGHLKNAGRAMTGKDTQTVGRRAAFSPLSSPPCVGFKSCCPTSTTTPSPLSAWWRIWSSPRIWRGIVRRNGRQISQGSVWQRSPLSVRRSRKTRPRSPPSPHPPRIRIKGRRPLCEGPGVPGTG